MISPLTYAFGNGFNLSTKSIERPPVINANISFTTGGLFRDHYPKYKKDDYLSSTVI